MFASESQRRASAEAPRSEERRLASPPGPRVVLLIEDDSEMRRFLASVLRGDGLLVVEASNGDDALDWLGPWALEGRPEAAPDLIVSDIRLPYFSGLEILEAIHIASRVVPVILITGFPDEETIEHALAQGAECVLSKPFDIAELRRAVRRALHAA